MVANRRMGQPNQPGDGQPVTSPVPAGLHVTASALAAEQTREAGPTQAPATMIQLTDRPDRATHNVTLSYPGRRSALD
jgi:hypothetical protein